MKKILSFLFCISIGFICSAQLSSFVTDARNYNNANIVTNATKQITAVKVNAALEKIIKGLGYIDTADRFLNRGDMFKTDNLSGLSSYPTARTNLGATTVGSNFFTLTNPSAIRFPRINADNTVSARTAAELLSDIGGQESLSFGTPSGSYSTGGGIVGNSIILGFANGSNPGIVSTGSQIITGVKFFNNDAYFATDLRVGRGANGSSFNTLVGANGFASTTTGANNNTGIGYNVGNAITTGATNTLVGYNAGSSITTGNYNTIIGYATGSTTLSNNIIIADGQSNIRLQFDNTGRGTLTGNDIRYATNYAANYTNRSLVDKGYADSVAAAIAGQAILDSATAINTEKGIAARVSGDTMYLRDYCKTVTTASSSTITINSDTTNMYTVTALAANLTIAAPTGTPEDGRPLLIRIKDNGTSRTLTWNSAFRAGTDFALPTATSISKTLYLQVVWNTADSKWDAVGLTQGF